MVLFVIVFILIVLVLVTLWSPRVKRILQRLKPVPYDVAIGRATWLYLHALVDHLPSNATLDEKIAMATHIGDFARFYPCLECRKHMSEYIKNNPIRYENKAQLVFWMFTFHNAVNKNLKKATMKETQYMSRLSDMGIINVTKAGQCSKCQRL